MQAGVVEQLSPGVHRLVAPNPSLMTGPGTNTYLLGHKRVTVLDPGPAIDEHVEAINAALGVMGAELEQVVVTHTHPDHSPSAALLAQQHGVPLIGRAIDDDGYQDTSFQPHVELQHDQAIDVDGDILRAVYTPGHVDNHFCFLHEPSGLMFTGDHIMQGSTVVIIPPAGDMADYIASLETMLRYPLRALAPGHGSVIDDAQAEIRGLIAHRLGRERKVRDALQRHGAGDLAALVKVAYDDVSADIHDIAQLSLWAHLLKLKKQGEVREQDGIWHPE